MTKLSDMRERSVVKSSVIPSAKYSWSGSFDRFAKGRTTIDSRGAEVFATAGGICGFAAAGAWTDTAGEFPLGQAHQATIAKPIAARGSTRVPRAAELCCGVLARVALAPRRAVSTPRQSGSSHRCAPD